LQGPHSKAVVFLVDDDPSIREALSDALEAEGYLVLAARDGREALARMRSFTGTAVALIDLLMPEMTGWQLVEAMKNDHDLEKIPIIVCSAYPEVPIFGVEYFLKKPSSLDEIVAALDRVLKR
jgi:CheY-like chemotaxis protein